MAKHHTIAQFEFFVLLSVARLGPEARASGIRASIEERANRPTALGAVYAALGRLEEKRLVRHTMEEPSPVRGGRGRKHFRITDLGRVELLEVETAVRRMLGDLAPAPAGLGERL